MGQPIIRYKDRQPDAVRYDGWDNINFPAVTLAASQANTVIQGVFPIGLNYKIIALSAVIIGAVAGTVALNVVSGTAAEGGIGTPDNRLLGVVPPTVAAAGTQLFPADQAMTMTGNLVQTFYVQQAAQPMNLWDVIWPANSLLTLRTATGVGTTGTLYVTIHAVPADIHYNLPDQMHPFLPSAAML